ncbi:MAG: hypothetical protein ACRDSF_02455 [Pseudonocardiaceae bacterium]
MALAVSWTVIEDVNAVGRYTLCHQPVGGEVLLFAILGAVLLVQ